ncbi:MAG: lipopolysaccharide heptosyltransferase II [bacterium]
MGKHKRIIIIQTAFIGDVILTLPLIEKVYNKYNGSKISFLITPKAYDLVKANPYISEIIVYDKNGKDKGLKNFLKLAGKIKTQKYDLAVLPHRSVRSAMLVYYAGIPDRIGFDRSAGKMFLTRAVKYSWDKHEAERNLDLIEEKAEDKKIPIFLDTEDIKKADRFVKEKGITGKDCLIGVAPGSVWATKRWLKERYAELINRLIDDFGAKIIIFGGSEDKDLAEEINDMTGNNLVIAAGKLSIGESASAISKCRYFVANDTAPLHLASAFHVPAVAIFGPTITGFGFGPYSPRFAVVEKDLKCRPCGRHGHRKCPKIHFKCMREITTEDVFKAFRRLFDENRP